MPDKNSKAGMITRAVSLLLLTTGLLLFGHADGDPLYDDVSYVCSLELQQKHGYSIKWRHTCSCLLYQADVLLTTASCVAYKRPEQLRVVCFRGDHKYIRAVKRVSTHEHFVSKPSLQQDLAVVFLDLPTSIYLSHAFIQPKSSYTSRYPCRKQECYCHLLLWDFSHDQKVTGKLRQVAAGALQYTKCRQKYRPIACGNICFQTHLNGIDGYNDYTPSCVGQTGAPVVCDGVLRGLLSWGSSDDCLSYPLVFTDLSSYHIWIKKAVH